MRQFVNVELFERIPEGLQSIIKPVLKISDGGALNPELVTTTDSMWIASCTEIGLSPTGLLPGQGELYASIFSSDKSSRKKDIMDNTLSAGWWLRSSYYSQDSSTLFWRVTDSGGSYSDIAYNSFYVAFGFCI